MINIKHALFALMLSLAMLPADATANPEEIAAVLSQAVINVRSSVAKNFTESNKIWWLPDALYRYILARNGVLPAAIAGEAFHTLNKSQEVVTLKMVVAAPRNEANKPDPIEQQILEQVVRSGAPVAISTPDAAYHGRPIKVAEWCLRCHGEPKGEPDPIFPKYKREGWKLKEVIGAATARVKR